MSKKPAPQPVRLYESLQMTTEVVGDPPVTLVLFRIHTKDYDRQGKMTPGTTPWFRATPEMMIGLGMQLQKGIPTLVAHVPGTALPNTDAIPGARVHFGEDGWKPN